MVILDGMETVLETLEMLEHGRAGRFRFLMADGVDNHLVKLCGVPRTGQAAHALAQPQHRLGEYLHEQLKHTVARGAGQDQVELLVVLEALLGGAAFHDTAMRLAELFDELRGGTRRRQGRDLALNDSPGLEQVVKRAIGPLDERV